MIISALIILELRGVKARLAKEKRSDNNIRRGKEKDRPNVHWDTFCYFLDALVSYKRVMYEGFWQCRYNET